MDHAPPVGRKGDVQPWRGVVALLRAAGYEYERDYARYFASAMVYFALYSLVPLVLLLLAVLGLLLRFSDAAAAAERQVLATVDASLGAEALTTIQQLLDRLEQQSVATGLLSLAGLVLTSSVLFRNLRLCFRAIWKCEPPLAAGSFRAVVRATLQEYVVANLIVLVGGLLLLLALGLMAVTQWLGAAGWLLTVPVPLILVTLTFALLLKTLPPVRLPWRDVWLAAVVCAVAWTVASEMVVLYGMFFGSSQGASGAIGGILVGMLWLNLVSKLLFFGGELCKVIALRDRATSAA